MIYRVSIRSVAASAPAVRTGRPAWRAEQASRCLNRWFLQMLASQRVLWVSGELPGSLFRSLQSAGFFASAKGWWAANRPVDPRVAEPSCGAWGSV